MITHTKRIRPGWVFVALTVLLLGALWASVALGAVSIPLDETLAVVFQAWGWVAEEVKRSHQLIVQEIRLPRALAGALVGWMLAASGMVMQGVFQNPLASPYVLGIASGASAGAALVIVAGVRQWLGGAALPLGAFMGGLLAVGLVYGLMGMIKGRQQAYTLILAGVALGALFSAITTFLIVLSGEQMREIVFWVMGNLGRANWEYLPWLGLFAAGGSLVLTLYMRDLNAFSLGEKAVFHLGINPRTLTRVLLLTATLMTSMAISVSGTIGFVGLITPHAMRLLVGPDHRLLLPACALAGAIFLVVSDTLARTALAPVELPVGVLTAFTGAPFFLFLLVAQTKRKQA